MKSIIGDVLVRTISIEQYKEFSKNTSLSFYPWQKIDDDVIFNTSNFSTEGETDGLIKEFLRKKIPKSYNKTRKSSICFKLVLVSLIKLKV